MSESSWHELTCGDFYHYGTTNVRLLKNKQTRQIIMNNIYVNISKHTSCVNKIIMDWIHPIILVPRRVVLRNPIDRGDHKQIRTIIEMDSMRHRMFMEISTILSYHGIRQYMVV